MRPSERLFQAYFLYAAVVAWVLPVPLSTRIGVTAVNAALIGFLPWYARLEQERPWPPRTAWRNLMPCALILLAYKEMGWFAQPHHDFPLERAWVEWDRLVLDAWGVKAAIESVPGLGAWLEFAYLMVYATLPLAVGLVYLEGGVARMERLLFPLVLACLSTYALFPYFPSEPPRTVFPGELFPSYQGAFRRLNWWIVEGGGIHTSVFPSGHVAAAFASAFGFRRAVPGARKTSAVLCLMAASIFVATVYGRYHYLVDALAGLLLGVVSLGAARWIDAHSRIELG